MPYPEIDPVIFRLGPFAPRWYGLMYVLGLTAAYLLIRRQIREQAGTAPGAEARIRAEGDLLDGLIAVLALGVILGGRLGYVLFYNPGYYLAHPAEIPAIWHGGMSFHGGLLGTLALGWWYLRRHGADFWTWADRAAVTAPVGLFFGRLGNFINGELYGRPADVPWAMVFPGGGLVPRHPSQLYEAGLEGLLLFALLWPLRNRPWAAGRKTALFLAAYGAARIAGECFRQPDPQLGFLYGGWLTMGQVLSAAMAAAGIGLWAWRGRQAGGGPLSATRRSTR
ncbi:prolipoprotein diacylglyceryl transferase [Dissulfurirhabdus thermomarina]|uniref:Phosphatidylglycerol--prolipoprotein diacylglyceryl transferase n=1 Tax=Dissulfurirhabdus thermomarina TaxID=1765737 RepID=A0A6N9TUL4_DISTH|nr:prolipoprotein diacylglyceryl transferase [Dissulfurirhabdus thermomarina]NMX22676.1 prolipoprotein diacylglyceryl transferase [Dissulfurirhabdus thermomarina]